MDVRQSRWAQEKHGRPAPQPRRARAGRSPMGAWSRHACPALCRPVLTASAAGSNLPGACIWEKAWVGDAGWTSKLVGGGLRSCAHSSDSAHAVATEDRPPLSLPTPHKGACLRVSAAASMRGLGPRGRGCVRRGVRRTPRRAAATPTQHIQPCPHHALALPVALLAVPHAMRRGASPPYTHSPQLAPPQICPRSPRACRRRTFSSFRR